MEAKIDTSKFTIMELLKNEAIALKFFRTYLEKGENN